MVFPRLSSKEEQERIAALKRLLAETKAGWNSAIADLKEAGRICKQTQEQLAEARKAAGWTPITPENLPKKGQVFYENGYARTIEYDWEHAYQSGWFIAPPAPEGSAKPCA